MYLNKATGLVLRYGVYIAIAVMIIGIIVLRFDEGVGTLIMYVGVALLILTPFFSIIASAVALHMEEDYIWLRVALMVLLITGIGIIVAFFLR